jgi:hypothetical protein
VIHPRQHRHQYELPVHAIQPETVSITLTVRHICYAVLPERVFTMHTYWGQLTDSGDGGIVPPEPS